ncbi:MAG: hypothetical protein N2512_14945, partial [Armatimonadetes bacterium]|nr:hypothetical protein [Armatimonadota bacterium]
MPEPHLLVRRPVSDEARTLLEWLVKRRRDGLLVPPAVQDATDELGWVAAGTRRAAQEMHDRRLLVLAGAGTLAELRWPRLTDVAGKRVFMTLADQLAAVGAAVSPDMAEAWTEAEETGEVPPPEKTGDTAADHVWLVVRAAYHGGLAEALSAARRATAATIAAGVVPLLARAAGWIARVLTVLGDPASPALRYELPMTDNEQAALAYEAGWRAELVRNRDQARAAYDEALRLDPGFLRAAMRKAWTTFAAGWPDAALADLDPLIARNPTLSAARLLRAEILIHLAAMGQAPADWVETAKADIASTKEDPRGDRGLASLLASRLLLERGDVPRAINAARQAVALEPSRPENYHALGLALTQA